MAQLFTIYFPKYYFDLQKEFSIEFAFPLPFEYVVEDGICYVSSVHYDQDNEGDPHHWHKKGLQPGLRIITINDKSLVDDYKNHIDEDDDEGSVLDQEAMDDVFAMADTEKVITIHFREEVSPEDFSIPLGLSYVEDVKDNDDQCRTEEATLSPGPSRHSKAAPSMSLGLGNRISSSRSNGIIQDSQIGASSFCTGYEPPNCRLNHPHTFWQPSGEDQTTLDTWLRIDLGMKQMITKLHLQGSPDHSSYVRSFWIDYSDDCCQWKSHPLGEIRCKYRKHKLINKGNGATQPLQNVYDDVSTIDMNNVYAEIQIWPAITARFIRIRPYTVYNKVAVRLELFGFPQVVAAANLSFARVVTLYDVNEMDKKKLMERVTNLPANTKVIQVDCKAVISAALDRAGLTSVGFLKADDDHFICIFTTSGAETSERALNELADVGVGREMGVISTTAIAFRNEPQTPHTQALIKKKDVKKAATFSDSVKSRMIVAQVVERIMNSSAFTFDYVCMLVVASLIAAGGLATDNAVIVVASMLVSPLMGPVLAFTFGVTLKEVNMATLGLKNELLSLFICVICGFIVGFFYAILSENVYNWPTEQMSSRGTILGLADGAFIAAASGVGVALSVLGDYLSTVVGVAISASLLPPAVNCGMLASFPIFAILYPKWIPTNKRYKNKKALLSMAGWSLLLTIENIIIIFAVSRLMFWIKNVYITKDHHEKVWKSVTNFRQNYHRLHSMGAKGARGNMQSAVQQQTEMMNLTMRNESLPVTPPTPQIHGTLDEKMRQTLEYAMQYDFGKDSHTIKRGVLSLNRQRSLNLHNQSSSGIVKTKSQTTLEIDVLDKSEQISSRNSSVSKDDSDQSDIEEEDKDKKKHVGVKDLFTPDTVATMRTPQVNDMQFDYDQMEHHPSENAEPGLSPLVEGDGSGDIDAIGMGIAAQSTSSLKSASNQPLVDHHRN